MTKQLDVLLVLGYFRSATPYLSIIRHLAPRLRIGIVEAAIDPSFLSSTAEAQAGFIRLCEAFGAQVIAQNEPIEAQLLVVQQFPYPERTVEELNGSIRARRRVGLMAFAQAGREKHDRFLKDFGINKVYVPSKRFTSFLLSRRGANDRYAGIEIIEVGLPYRKYPVFPKFTADYLFAAPTVFSYDSEVGKQKFLRVLLRLLDAIPKTERIVYKPHNAVKQDYFAPPLYYSAARTLSLIPGFPNTFTRLQYWFPAKLRKHTERIVTCMFHLQAVRRMTAMEAVTSHSSVALEAFLPGVRKGVIGGLSNTIWGALYFGLPYYNCVDPAIRTGNSTLVKRSADDLLNLNLQFFNVEYCEGNLVKGADGAAIVTDADRQGDLIRSLLEDVELGARV